MLDASAAKLLLGLFGSRFSERAIVVMVRACIDESATHGNPDDPLLMYGVVARFSRWERFDKAWGKTLRRENVAYVRAHDIMESDGPFKGWQIERKAKFTEKLETIFERDVEFSFCTILKQEDFEAYRSKGLELNTILDSDYGVSFRIALSFLQQAVPSLIPGKEHDVYVVVENGHPKCGCITEIHRRMQAELDDCIVRSVVPVNKRDSYGTQSADIKALPILAHERRGADYHDFGQGTFEEIKPFETLNGRKRVYRLPITEDVLTDMRDQTILSKAKFRKRFGHLLSGKHREKAKD